MPLLRQLPNAFRDVHSSLMAQRRYYRRLPARAMCAFAAHCKATRSPAATPIFRHERRTFTCRLSHFAPPMFAAA